MWNLEHKTNKTQLMDLENSVVVARSEEGWGVGEMGEGVLEVQTSGCEKYRSWVW